MPEIELTDQQVAEFEQRLLDAIPPQGSIGNSALRRRLEWSEDRYWYITNRLLRTGAVEQGRGRGGSIHRVAPLQTPPAAATPSSLRIAESALYDPIVATIRNHWVSDHERSNQCGMTPIRRRSRTSSKPRPLKTSEIKSSPGAERYEYRPTLWGTERKEVRHENHRIQTFPGQ